MLSPRAQQLLQPRRNALLAVLAGAMDRSHLRAIAEADYGDGADDHYAALEKIRREITVPAPLEWIPREVLELIRWSRPEDPGWKPGLSGQPGHLIRAFSCAALLSAGCDATSRDLITSENPTLAALLDSLGSLDIDYDHAALSALALRVDSPPEEWDEEPFFWFALLILALRVYRETEPDLVSELARATIASELSIRNARWYAGPKQPGSWLLGTTQFDLNHDLWKKRVNELRAFSLRLQGENQKVVSWMASALEAADY